MIYTIRDRIWWRCTKKKRNLTLLLSNFTRTWRRVTMFTFVSSSRNTIQDEFFSKEPDKLRTHNQKQSIKDQQGQTEHLQIQNKSKEEVPIFHPKSPKPNVMMWFYWSKYWIFVMQDNYLKQSGACIGFLRSTQAAVANVFWCCLHHRLTALMSLFSHNLTRIKDVFYFY